MENNMTDRPMADGERVLAQAELIARDDLSAMTASWIEVQLIARALLSTSAAIRGMREALEKYRDDYCEGWCKENGGAGHFDDCGGCPAARALSGIKTEGQ